jgi:hypothetical protein
MIDSTPIRLLVSGACGVIVLEHAGEAERLSATRHRVVVWL